MAPKPNIVPRLVIIEGKDKGKVIPLSEGTAVIGRTKGDVVAYYERIAPRLLPHVVDRPLAVFKFVSSEKMANCLTRVCTCRR